MGKRCFYCLLYIIYYVLFLLGNTEGQSCSGVTNMALTSTPSLGTANDGTIFFQVVVIGVQPPGATVTQTGV